LLVSEAQAAAGRSVGRFLDFAVCSKTFRRPTLGVVPEHNPIVRIFIGLLTVAVLIRVILWLLAPVVPALIVASCAFGAFRLCLWWRGRW
jgi:hypothetical protein